MNIQASESPLDPASVHQRLSDLCSQFHLLQEAMLAVPEPEQGEQFERLADDLILLCEAHIDQVLGELFLAEYSTYNFIKPLYVGASLVELIRRYNDYADSPIDSGKRVLMTMGALGYNLGLLSYEKQVYATDEEFPQQELEQLRERYPQQSADLLKAVGLDQPVVQDVVRNHNIASENPSADAMMLRTPFIYAGIAMPQQTSERQLSLENPIREFAKMYSENKLDVVFGGLFLKIQGLAPIGSIVNFESREKAIVIRGPNEIDISSSTVRMLTNRNGVQLIRPGECYALNGAPTKFLGLANHHSFAWTRFAPYLMWIE